MENNQGLETMQSKIISDAAETYIDEIYEQCKQKHDMPYGYDMGYLDAVDVEGRKAFIAGAEWAMLGKSNNKTT